jgi:G3E family GTPase
MPDLGGGWKSMAGGGETMRRGDDVLPISVLTGFLGSGKTTFLKRAVSSPDCSDTAVLINEIGEIGLDHYLVETIDGPVLELPGGCLCCAVREDVAQTLRALLARRDRGEGPAFRRIIIETTGLADPAPVLFTLGADLVLDERLRLDRVVTMVDAVAGAATLDRFAEAARQVAVADRLLVTKTDLVPYERGLRDRIEALNANAPCASAGDAIHAAAILFGAEPSDLPRPNAHFAHGVHTHGVAAHAILLPRDGSRLDFTRALGGLVRERGEDLLRVKGLMRFSDRPDRPAFIQGAQHALFPPVWLERWPDEDRRSRLVFIVKDIALADILERLSFAGAEPYRPVNRSP